MSPGTVTVTCQFTHPGDRTIESLAYWPLVPDGWIVSNVGGDSNPELALDGAIAWAAASIPQNPVNFHFDLTVPPGEAGAKELTAFMEYQFEGMGSPDVVMALPDPLQFVDLANTPHKADFRTSPVLLVPNWKIDTTEVNRVLAIWRNAAGYHVDPTQPDGYSAGAGAQGTPHTADFRTSPVLIVPNWKIDTTELNRVLAIWRNAAGYHVDPTQPDGFAAGL
jgi:hypothetical protein